MPTMPRWTAFVKFPSGDIEEVDSSRVLRSEALADVLDQLVKDYNPGGVVVKMVPVRSGVIIAGKFSIVLF